MNLKEWILSGRFDNEFHTLDILEEYIQGGITVQDAIKQLRQQAYKGWKEQYDGLVEQKVIKETINDNGQRRRATIDDDKKKIDIKIKKHDLLVLLNQQDAIEACNKSLEFLFSTTMGQVIQLQRLLQERQVVINNLSNKVEILEDQAYGRDIYREELENQVNNLKVEHKMVIQRWDTQKQERDNKYQELLKRYNKTIQLINQIQQVDKEVQKETIIVEDTKFKKEHKRYHDNNLYRLVLQTISQYSHLKRLPRQKIIGELLKEEIVKDFLKETGYKLNGPYLIRLQEQAIIYVGEEFGLTIEDIKSKETRKRLGLEVEDS